jgi:hypothetical protein
VPVEELLVPREWELGRSGQCAQSTEAVVVWWLKYVSFQTEVFWKGGCAFLIVDKIDQSSDMAVQLNFRHVCRIFNTAEKLSGLLRTPFIHSKQIELFKYTSGRWLYNKEECGQFSFVSRLF